MFSTTIPEAQVIIAVANKFYKGIPWTLEVGTAAGKIDFAVMVKQPMPSIFPQQYTLWAEAKRGAGSDIYESFIQLILTIGRNQLHTTHMPPNYLGAFDAQKMAFVEYHKVQDVFFQNGINWKVPANKHHSEQFILLKQQLDALLRKEVIIFNYETHSSELQEFILNNLKQERDANSKALIDRNNFIKVFSDWQQQVKPCITDKWDTAEQLYIYPADFFLADLLSDHDSTLNAKDLLYVQLCNDHYEIEILDNSQLQLGRNIMRIEFKSKKEYDKFWSIYERPPLKEFWDHMVARRDLLLPFKARERKGAFFTPPRWAKLAQQYITNALGKDWQNDYYVWDCAAGTGNLLEGLTHKDNLWASTIDKPDVAIMRDRIENKNLKMWKDNVFQFDFLNDELLPMSKGGKLPDALYEIITNQEKRKHLLFLINPPYGEAPNTRTMGADGNIHHTPGVQESMVKERFKKELGTSLKERFVQFFVRIHQDISECKIAAFVTPKYICGITMKQFRSMWKARYLGGFATPADTHENCIGKFPICLFIWNLSEKEDFPDSVVCDIYNKDGACKGTKTFIAIEDKRINEWIKEYNDVDKDSTIGTISCPPPTFESDTFCWIHIKIPFVTHTILLDINKKNFLPIMVYYAVRHCIPHTWINDRDNYFYPHKEWEQDVEFQHDCLIFTLFDDQNKVKLREGENHWIPFSEDELGLTSRIKSRFMSDFLRERRHEHGSFSEQAQHVLQRGLELWKYYLSHKGVDINASFYDIREYFQGRYDGGSMKKASSDLTYNKLIASLRAALAALAKKIEEKVYLYGFLK